ncbi:MAG: septum formation initiator family protein [Alphaproteobacteria bacterium]|nr:septum formation initiator family protein [Alphaproteobacteria bacterium]
MKAASKNNRNLISQFLVTLFSFGVFIYFGFHLMHGDRGYFALRGVNQKLAVAKEKHGHLLAEREVLENCVKLLRPGSLDPDMLDERVRVVLGFVDPDERILIEE